MESENSMFLLHGIRGGSITYFDLKKKIYYHPHFILFILK